MGARNLTFYLPVLTPDLWSNNAEIIKRTLDFLTGDLWRISLRPRSVNRPLVPRADHGVRCRNSTASHCFRVGLDSFVGAIDLPGAGEYPIFVSHYGDASTKSQVACASKLGAEYGDLDPRHVRANVSFDKNDMPNLGRETTTRARSFIFIALAALAASAIRSRTPIVVPENGLISLNVPLNSLRIGAWSTRTTHPFYLARWQELLDNLGIDAVLSNPYRFKTKGEMLVECNNKVFLRKSCSNTTSCSSISKADGTDVSLSTADTVRLV